jgi:hypothetical protein
MEINDIHIFLRNPVDYNTGVAIYNQFGTSALLKQSFAKYNNTFWNAKLIEEIRKLAQVHPEQKIVPSAKTKKPNQPVVNDQSIVIGANKTKAKRPFIDVTALPDDLRKKFIDNGNLVKDANYLKRFIHGAPPKDRLAIVAQIAELHEQNMANWNDIDYFIEHKKKRVVSEIKKEDKRLVERIPDNELMRKLLSYRTQRSKLKKSTKAADADKLRDLNTKIELLQKEIYG